MSISVNIVANGARTPLGQHAASSAAAYHAGISALGQHPFMVDSVGDPMRGALDALLDPSLMGPDRFLALAESPLREVCALLDGVKVKYSPMPIYLGLPEIRLGFSAQDAEAIRTGLARLNGLPVQISEVNVFTEGHSAGLLALAKAKEQIQKGQYEACLVGGVDSYFHPETMEWLDENLQLAGSVSRSAFVPGEGAGFCLLMTNQACKRLGINSLARVLAVAIGKESKLIKTADICLGEGCTSVVKGVASKISSPPDTINSVICDINGERYRSEEWGFVCLRLSQYFDDPTAYDSPADSWGDMGAASVPLFGMLACQAVARGYSKGPRTLLWASSEGGLRGAAILETNVGI